MPIYGYFLEKKLLRKLNLQKKKFEYFKEFILLTESTHNIEFYMTPTIFK